MGDFARGADEGRIEEVSSNIDPFLHPKFSKAYACVLADRYSHGTFRGCAVFDKFGIPKELIATTRCKPWKAHYSPLTNRISFNCKDDIGNVRGPGTTFFHEYGHYIANNVAIKIGESEEFKQLILNDVRAYTLNYMSQNNLRDEEAAIDHLTEFLYNRGAITHAIQDLFGGALSHGEFCSRFAWGHEQRYWRSFQNDMGVSTEAAAHMFEAQFSPDKYRLMEEFLPNAFNYYNRWLETLATTI